MSLSRGQAWDLLTKYNQEPFHLRHAVTVEHVMGWFARELGYGDREEFWGIVGLLHDLDFEQFPNQHCIKEQEILRELDVMHKAGIGGVEINTIQFPDQTADTVGCAALTWLSDEWIRMVNVAADGCRERGMVCDIIVGSGWPFGAEYLAPEEQVQMLHSVPGLEHAEIMRAAYAIEYYVRIRTGR